MCGFFKIQLVPSLSAQLVNSRGRGQYLRPRDLSNRSYNPVIFEGKVLLLGVNRSHNLEFFKGKGLWLVGVNRSHNPEFLKSMRLLGFNQLCLSLGQQRHLSHRRRRQLQLRTSR